MKLGFVTAIFYTQAENIYFLLNKNIPVPLLTVDKASYEFNKFTRESRGICRCLDTAFIDSIV
jgi:hypothetical protein